MGIGPMCTGVVVFRSGNKSYLYIPTVRQECREIKFTVNWKSGTKFTDPIKISHLPRRFRNSIENDY